jgi:hypothetical protein
MNSKNPHKQPRNNAGTGFGQKYDEPKFLRSMKLTDYAWDKLQQLAAEQGTSRTDIIEEFTRASSPNQLIIEAIDKFIESEALEYGKNPSQRQKPFNTDSRDWTKLKKLRKLLEDNL